MSEHSPEALQPIDENARVQQELLEQYGNKTVIVAGKEMPLYQAHALANALCPVDAAGRASAEGNAFVVERLVDSGHEVSEEHLKHLSENHAMHPKNVDPEKKNESEKAGKHDKTGKVDDADKLTDITPKEPAAVKIPEVQRAIIEAPARKIVQTIPLEKMLRSVTPVVEKSKPIKVVKIRPEKTVHVQEFVPTIKAPVEAVLVERAVDEPIKDQPELKELDVVETVSSPSKIVIEIVPAVAAEIAHTIQTAEATEFTEEQIIVEVGEDATSIDSVEFMELPLETTEEYLDFELPAIPLIVEVESLGSEPEQESAEGMMITPETEIQSVEGVAEEQLFINPEGDIENNSEVEKTPTQTVMEFVVLVNPALAEQVYEFVTAEDTPSEVVEIIEQKVERITVIADRLHELVAGDNGECEEAIQIEAVLIKEYVEILRIMGVEPNEEILKSFIMYVRSEHYELYTKSDENPLNVYDDGTHERKLFDEVSVFAKAQKASQKLAQEIQQGIGKLLVNNLAA